MSAVPFRRADLLRLLARLLSPPLPVLPPECCTALNRRLRPGLTAPPRPACRGALTGSAARNGCDSTGTGLTHQQASAIIQATVKPDLWQNIGGPSSISVFINPRAGLVISTTYGCHKEIERIMDTVRQSQFSSDPNLEYVAPPAPTNFMGVGGSHF